MNVNDMYSAMYSSLNCLYQEAPDEKLGEFLLKINPHVMSGEKSADPQMRRKFDKYMKKRMKGDSVTNEEGYTLVRDYINEMTEFKNKFDSLPLSDWLSLCQMLDMDKTISMLEMFRDMNESLDRGEDPGSFDLDTFLKENPSILEGANMGDVMPGARPGMGMPGMGAGYGAGAKPATSGIKTAYKGPDKSKKKKKKK